MVLSTFAKNTPNNKNFGGGLLNGGIQGKGLMRSYCFGVYIGAPDFLNSHMET